MEQRFNFYAANIGKEDFDAWRSLNNIPLPNDLTIEDRCKISSSHLGMPLHEERLSPDGVGRYRTFESGSIHWYPLFGSFMTLGAIRESWAHLNWEMGWLGYPVSEEYPICQNEVNELTAWRWGEFEDTWGPDWPSEMNDKTYATAQQFYGGLIYWLAKDDRTIILRRSGRFFRGCSLFQTIVETTAKSSFLERILQRFR
jgi:uncharacterized protein with LGFP repeats